MKISVIIPCYNEEAYIGQAIGSLFEQSYPPDEIIVVDDGSNDRSAEIARSFGKPVTVLPGAGKGAPLARNLGADYAAGEALMFFDADDVLGPWLWKKWFLFCESIRMGLLHVPGIDWKKLMTSGFIAPNHVLH